MRITTKKLIFIITAMLAGIVFMTSCSKNTEAAKKAKAEKTKQQAAENAAKKAAKASRDAEATTSFSDGKNTMTAARNGQYVTLNWHVDTASLAGGKARRIQIMRNLSGKKSLATVAILQPDAVTFQDCLPDEYTYRYWLRLGIGSGKYQEIGPVRVDLDKAGSTDYIKLGDKYKISVTRTNDTATIKWDFPEGEYKSIRIVRTPRPTPGIFDVSGKKTEVMATTERKSQNFNALPDPNAEYWYMFRIILKSGPVIDLGPFKAEYTRR